MTRNFFGISQILPVSLKNENRAFLIKEHFKKDFTLKFLLNRKENPF